MASFPDSHIFLEKSKKGHRNPLKRISVSFLILNSILEKTDYSCMYVCMYVKVYLWRPCLSTPYCTNFTKNYTAITSNYNFNYIEIYQKKQVHFLFRLLFQNRIYTCYSIINHPFQTFLGDHFLNSLCVQYDFFLSKTKFSLFPERRHRIGDNRQPFFSQQFLRVIAADAF